jgi:hypothetical protein
MAATITPTFGSVTGVTTERAAASGASVLTKPRRKKRRDLPLEIKERTDALKFKRNGLAKARDLMQALNAVEIALEATGFVKVGRKVQDGRVSHIFDGAKMCSSCLRLYLEDDLEFGKCGRCLAKVR